MGPLGFEGPYRTSCELTMKLIEEHKSALLNSLRPLIYDPDVKWRRQSSQGQNAEHAIREKINTKAVQHNQNIEKRLKRYVSVLFNIFHINLKNISILFNFLFINIG